MTNLNQIAETETRAYLRTGPSPERLSELTVKIHQTADGHIRSAQVLGPAVACAKGCSHCCHQYVTALIPEVLRLAESIRATYSPERLAALEERIRSFLSAVREIPGEGRVLTARLACPILESDLCGAFEARPLACRRHNSVNVAACIEYKEGIRKTPALANAKQFGVGQALFTGWAIGLLRSRLQEAIVEMIPALDIALHTPDAAKRYLAGEAIFDSAIVAGYDPAPIRRAIKAGRF